jgi:hypothetical protein
VRGSVARKGKARRKARGTRRAAETETEATRARLDEARATREIAGRALRRLDVLEYVILLAALILALLGGALVAWLLTATAGLSFRIGWAVSSLLLFIVPGGTVYLRELRREKE